MATVLQYIEQIIGYTFQNKKLLQQAFTRRSYAEEHGGQNNEILEFFGDKALDLAVVKFLAQSCGSINEQGEYQPILRQDEGRLTRIKANLVERDSLSSRMKDLNLSRFLRMGRGDGLNCIQERPSVQEDLFEAIIGAVALDCNWDMPTISNVVEKMLAPDPCALSDAENPIALVQEWAQKNLHVTPEYDITNDEIKFTARLSFPGTFFSHSFWGVGSSKKSARENAATAAWKEIKELNLDALNTLVLIESMEEQAVYPLQTPEQADDTQSFLFWQNKLFSRSVNDLQEFAQKGQIEMPVYEFKRIGGSDHAPLWSCVCTLPKSGLRVEASDSSKKEAKKEAARLMLQKAGLQKSDQIEEDLE